ncbi:myoD family inhibitor domain-containing protein isoform X2 [Cetorhinus maximus]
MSQVKEPQGPEGPEEDIFTENSLLLHTDVAVNCEFADLFLFVQWWWSIKLTGGGGSTNILNDGGAQHISAKEKAEAFATIFSQKCQVDDPSRPSLEILSITGASLQPIRFTPRDIKKWLKALDTAKAMGSDNIPAIVLKTCAPEFAAPLAKLFQYSYNTGIHPAMWNIVQVCPVCKKQGKFKPANYRPINLLSITSRVMEGVINYYQAALA